MENIKRLNEAIRGKAKTKSDILILAGVLLTLTAVIFLFLKDYDSGIGTVLALNLMAGSVNGRFSKSLKNKLDVVSILVNNSCNLKCRHCYLQTKKHADYLSHEEWNKFFYSLFTDINPGTISFAGKEVFFDRESVQILLNAISIKNIVQSEYSSKTEIGVITNASLIHNYKDLLLANKPDYFDISIDGLPEYHDYIRGKGAFDSIRENISWLTKHFENKVWITHTLFEDNILQFPQFVNFMNKEFGISKFSVGFYKEKNYTDPSIALKQDQFFSHFTKIISTLRNIKLNNHTEIIFEFDHTQDNLLPHLLATGLVYDNSPLSSNTISLNQNLDLTINIAFIPVGLWRSVRISPEGYWIAAEDLLDVKNYPTLAVTDLKSHDFDAESIYYAGLNSGRKQQLMNDSVCDIFSPQENPTQMSELLINTL